MQSDKIARYAPNFAADARRQASFQMIKIESLVPKHASLLNELIKTGLREFPSSFTTDLSSIEDRPDQNVADHLRSLQSSDDFRLGAFSDEGKLVGTVRLIRHQSPKQSHSADIVFFYVCHKCQNQGIGRKTKTPFR